MKLLIIQCAALGYQTWEHYSSSKIWEKLSPKAISTVFPAVTCSVQASFRTASEPAEHGMISNGFFDRFLAKAFFWEQSSRLYSGERIWGNARKRGKKVGQVCWQQSIGRDSDMFLTPAPIHKHHGGMIQDFHCTPDGLYDSICSEIRQKFNLFSYWGPFASGKSSNWITDATVSILNKDNAPDLLLTYIPHLDYDMQRVGPVHKKVEKAFCELESMLERLVVAAEKNGYEVVLFGDYAITEAKQVVYPNQILRENNLFNVRSVKGLLYQDIYTSDAFAMVDHQVAHIYLNSHKCSDKVKDIFANTEGVAEVLDHHDMNHKRAGEFILKAESGCWFAYPWWKENEKAPDYATHVDIHSKPGFDPCELFMEIWPPMSITTDVTKVKGTHGLAGDAKETAVFCGSTISLGHRVDSVLKLSQKIKSILDEK